MIDPELEALLKLGNVDKEHMSKIANLLINKHVIESGKKKYHIVELEFYYYSKQDPTPDDVTYPRCDKKAGQLFFHYSGMDICFMCDAAKDPAYYGGILVRCVSDGKEFYGGPLVACNEILNAATSNPNGETKMSMPELVHLDEPTNYAINQKPAARVGIKNDEHPGKYYRDVNDGSNCFDRYNPLGKKTGKYNWINTK